MPVCRPDSLDFRCPCLEELILMETEGHFLGVSIQGPNFLKRWKLSEVNKGSSMRMMSPRLSCWIAIAP